MLLPSRLLLAVVAGVAVALSFEPLALAVLLPLGVAGLSVAVSGVGPRRGLLIGSVFGTTFMLVLLPWLRVIGVDAWIALSALEGVFYGLLGLSAAVVQRLRWWPLWTAMLWVGIELLRSTVPFGGFPWGRLAFATADTPVASAFPYVGSAGATFLVALLGCTLAWVALEGRRVPVRAAAALTATVLLIALPAIGQPAGHDGSDTVTVAAVQGDVPGEGMDAFAERRVVLDNHVRATHELAAGVRAGDTPAPDLVVWPENSTDIDPFTDATVYADIQGAVDDVGVPVLVGAMVSGDEPGDVFNQGIVWLPRTGPAERYSKTHPVPFGEYIPFRDVFAPYISRLDQIPRDMVPGEDPGLLRMGGTAVGDVICFEVAYDDVLRDVMAAGAELLVVQTNNATYMGTGQIEQQFAISRLRALEHNRHVVVAATNGVSGIIGPDGGVVARAPVRERTVLVETVGLPAGGTAALTWAPAVELALSGGAGLAVLTGLWLRHRGREDRRAQHERPRETATAGTG